MTYDFEVSDEIPASPDEIYAAWMSSEGHAAMTGGEAHIGPKVGDEFDAWDGYIHGKTLELPAVKIAPVPAELNPATYAKRVRLLRPIVSA